MLLSLFDPETAISTLYTLLFFTVGCCIGSFMNVVIYRLPVMIYGEVLEEVRFSLAWPPSHCPVCRNRIKFYDNIPVASWILLRGKCRNCKTTIAYFYPLTEAVTGLWFSVVYFFMKDSDFMFLTLSDATAMLPLLGLFCLLYCITIIDFRHYLIPDVLSLGLLWSGMVLSVCGYIRVSPFQAVSGCVLAYCIIRTVQWGYCVLRRHEGLGGGDAKLFAAASVWVGLSQVPWLILFSAVCGGGLYIVKKFYHKNILEQNQPVLLQQNPGCGDSDILNEGFYIPFGPAIALATLVLFLTRIS